MSQTATSIATAAHERAGDAPLPCRRSICGTVAGAVGRFCGWWFGMAGLTSMFLTCPCCGQQACGNAVVGMGFVGAIGATLIRFRRWFSCKPSCTPVAGDAPDAATDPEACTPGHPCS